MSGEPVIPVNPISDFLKAHDRLLILILCLAVGVHFYSKVLGAWERHDQRVADTTHATLAANVASANAIADANAKAAAQYQALASQLADANKALASAQTVRNTNTQVQQVADKTLPPPAFAARWATLASVTPESIQPNATGFSVTPDAALATVVQLENVPTLQANLNDEQTTAANQSTQLASLTGVNVDLNSQIAALKNENIAEVQACTADKNLLKAKARKSKMHWFFGGFITGFIARQALKIPTGL